MAQPARLRLRRNVWDLDPQGPELSDYRKAIRAMRALPPEDHRSWEGQARIHNDTCPHGNWFFLPWHRAYLLHFEALIQHFSGNPNFSLPYWDWTRRGELPPAFTDPSPDNPLYLNGRWYEAPLLPEEVGPDVVRQIMATTDFLDFGSSRTRNQEDADYSGILEGTPHNAVHNWIGGEMASFFSPRDPIFWLHHANVDRLWAEWSARNPQTSLPSDPAADSPDPGLTRDYWLGFELKGYFDRDNRPRTARVRETLTTEGYGYTYEVRGGSPAGQPGLGLIETASAGSPREVVQLFSLPNRVLRTDQSVAFGIMVTPDVQAAYAKHLEQLRAGRPGARVRLYAEGVPVPTDPRQRIRLFLNHPGLWLGTPDRDPHFIGRYAFFGRAHPGHGGLTRDMRFDLTQTLIRLYPRLEALPSELRFQVQLVGRNQGAMPPEAFFSGIRLALEFRNLG